MLCNFYFVAFDGPALKMPTPCEFIYREGAATRLGDMIEHFEAVFAGSVAHGRLFVGSHSDNTPSSGTADWIHVQIQPVQPLLDAAELESRPSEFDKSVNLTTFYMESPFAKGKHGPSGMAGMWKKRTVFSVQHAFPYTRRRYRALSKKQYASCVPSTALYAALAAHQSIQQFNIGFPWQ